MGAALEVVVSLTQFSCGQCGGVYAINERVRKYHEERGTCWTCPYCACKWGYPNAGTLAAAQKALAEEKERHARTIARLNEEEKRANKESNARKKADKKLKRVEAGVCPECNRTFTNLARHMAGQHCAPLLRIGGPPLP